MQKTPQVLKTLITLPSVLHTGQRLLFSVAVHLLQQHMCPHLVKTISEGALRHTTHTPAPKSLLLSAALLPSPAASVSQQPPSPAVLLLLPPAC